MTYNMESKESIRQCTLIGRRFQRMDTRYCLIFSGIGNSKSFKEILINNKFNIIEEKIFSDHYEYKDQDIQKILKISKKKNLKALTTEKDYVKIPNNLRSEIDFIEIDIKIDQEEKLIKFIKSKINETN